MFCKYYYRPRATTLLSFEVCAILQADLVATAKEIVACFLVSKSRFASESMLGYSRRRRLRAVCFKRKFNSLIISNNAQVYTCVCLCVRVRVCIFNIASDSQIVKRRTSVLCGRIMLEIHAMKSFFRPGL